MQPVAFEYNYQPIGADSLNTNTVMHWNEVSACQKWAHWDQ